MTTPKTLLLTRPRDQAEAFAAALDAALPGRFRALVSPVLRIAPLDVEIDLAGAQGLVFTSANGVEVFAGRSPERGLPAWCVGALTAQAARAAGFLARSADGDVGRLADLVAREARAGAGEVVHVRGRHAAGDLVGRLAAAGAPARGLELYDQVRRPLTAEARDLIAAGRLEVLTAFSPRSAALVAEEAQAAGWSLGGSVLVALSAAADAAHDAPEPGRRVLARTPTRAGMIAALAGL